MIQQITGGAFVASAATKLVAEDYSGGLADLTMFALILIATMVFVQTYNARSIWGDILVTWAVFGLFNFVPGLAVLGLVFMLGRYLWIRLRIRLRRVSQ